MVRQSHKIHPYKLSSHIATTNTLNTLACKASLPVSVTLRQKISFWLDAKAMEHENMTATLFGVVSGKWKQTITSLGVMSQFCTSKPRNRVARRECPDTRRPYPFSSDETIGNPTTTEAQRDLRIWHPTWVEPSGGCGFHHVWSLARVRGRWLRQWWVDYHYRFVALPIIIGWNHKQVVRGPPITVEP